MYGHLQAKTTEMDCRMKDSCICSLIQVWYKESVKKMFNIFYFDNGPAPFPPYIFGIMELIFNESSTEK